MAFAVAVAACSGAGSTERSKAQYLDWEQRYVAAVSDAFCSMFDEYQRFDLLGVYQTALDASASVNALTSELIRLEWPDPVRDDIRVLAAASRVDFSDTDQSSAQASAIDVVRTDFGLPPLPADTLLLSINDCSRTRAVTSGNGTSAATTLLRSATTSTWTVPPVTKVQPSYPTQKAGSELTFACSQAALDSAFSPSTGFPIEADIASKTTADPDRRLSPDSRFALLRTKSDLAVTNVSAWFECRADGQWHFVVLNLGSQPCSIDSPDFQEAVREISGLSC